MATSAQPSATPQTPPNFYAQAAQGASPAPQKAVPDDSKDFLDATTKLLTIFDKLQKLKPNGKDVSKYVKAAALAIQKAKEFALDGNNGDSSSGTPSDSGGDATPPPTDTGAS